MDEQNDTTARVMVADCQPTPKTETPARKWSTQAGPIQSKKVRDAIGKISWEGRSYAELSGVIGGQEQRFSYTNVFGGGREDCNLALTALAEKFNYTVTRENYQAIIMECERVCAELAKSRPVIDKRRTPEADAELAHKRQEREAKEAASLAERKAAWDIAQAKEKAEAEKLRSEAAASLGNDGTMVRYNKEHDGVEIAFPNKPTRDVINDCKAAGFRWSMRSKVWYHRFDSASWLAAHRIARIAPEAGPARGQANPDGAMVQAQEDAFQDSECARIGA